MTSWIVTLSSQFDALSGSQQLGVALLLFAVILVPLVIRLEILELRRERRFHAETLQRLNAPPPRAAGCESERTHLGRVVRIGSRR